ncbi:hypothetical protein RSOL_114830, partial [Rhizoctonia solani AG-3 Rhs1AP]
MPAASTSKPGMSRLPTVGGSRIPIVGGTRIPALGGKSALTGKALAKEKEDVLAGKKRGLVVQQSPNPKARKILRTSNAPAPAGSKPTATFQKPTLPASRKRSLGSPPASARKRQRTDLPVRSSARAVDPLDIIPPTPPRATEHQVSHSPISPPRTQAPMERARSTTAFNFPLGDQSSLLGAVEMDVSSAGLYSDFENGGSPSPTSKTTNSSRTTASSTRRSSTRRSSLTPKPRRKATTPRRSPKSAQRLSVTPRRYEPKSLPPPIVTPTAMQAKKEARLAEAQAKLVAARSEAETGPPPAQAMTAVQARIAAAQAEAEKRLRMSVESEAAGGLSIVQEESYQEEGSEPDDGPGEGEDDDDGEATELEQEQEQEGEQGEEEQDGEDTLQPLHDEDQDPGAANEAWSSQVNTPRASSSKTPRAQSGGTTTPAFKFTTTPATRPTTTPAYKPTTTPATVKFSKTTAPTTTPATSHKGKKKAVFKDTPHPQASESPSEYDPGEHEDSDEPTYQLRRPSLGFSLAQLSLDTPHHPLRSQRSIAELLLEEEGEIANRTRSRLASGERTKRESLAGALNGLKLAEQSGDSSMVVEDGGDDDEDDDDEGDETVRRPRKSVTTTPKTSGPSYSTTPRNPSKTPRNVPSTTPRYDPPVLPEDTSTTPRNDPSTSGSTTPYYPSTTEDATTTPEGDPSPSTRSHSRLRKSDSPLKGRGRARVRGLSRESRKSPSPTFAEDQSGFFDDQTQTQQSVYGDQSQHSVYGDQTVSVGRSPTPRARGRGRGRASPQKRWGSSRRVLSSEVDDSESEEDLDAPTEMVAVDRTIKTKSPMKVEVVIPRRSTTALGKSVSKTPAFKSTSSTASFQPTTSQSTTSTSSLKPSASTSTLTSAFSSPGKVTLQQPTPELSSLDCSPGSHHDMITEGSVASRQDDEQINEGGDMSQSLGSQHEFTVSQHDSTGSQQSIMSRPDMDESSGSRQDVDMNFTDEVPETSLPGTPLFASVGKRYDYAFGAHGNYAHGGFLQDYDYARGYITPHVTSERVYPRAPPAPVDDSIEFTPASRFDFNESHMDFEETPAVGTKFAQSTPFIRNGGRPSIGLGSFQKLHLDDSEGEEIPDSQAGPSEYDDQPERIETTPQREITVAVDTSSPNRSLRTERVSTPRAPRLSNPMDDEEDEDEPELPPSPSAGRSNLHEGGKLPDENGINGRKLSDILMARARQARDKSGNASQDRDGNEDVLGAGEMTRLSDQARSVLKQPSGSGSQIPGNRSTSFGASTSSHILSRYARGPSSLEAGRSQQKLQDFDASVHFDRPSRIVRRSATPVFRRSNQPEEPDEDEVSSVADQAEEARSSGASVVSPVASDGPEEEYGVAENESEDEEEMDYDENGQPIIKLSGPPEAIIQAKSALIQLGYIEDEELVERYSRIRSSRSRSRSISRAHDSTRNISIGSSPRGHLGDRTTGLSRTQMMVEASRYEDWEPPSRHQLRTRKWTEHDWRMLAHYMRRVQKSQALRSGLSSRQELDLRMVDVSAVVERFVEEEAHGLKLEGEWDRSEIAGRVEFLIKTEGNKKDGSWKSTLFNITVPDLSTQKTRRYEPKVASPEVESPAKGRMLPTALSALPGPTRIAAAEKQAVASTSRVTQYATPVPQTTKPVTDNPKQVSAHTARTTQTVVAKPAPHPPRQEPEDMLIDQRSREESSVEPDEQQPSEEFSAEEPPVEEPPTQEHSVEDQQMEEHSAGEPHVEEAQAGKPEGGEDYEDDGYGEGVEDVEDVDDADVEDGEGGEDDEDDENGEEEQYDGPLNQPRTYQVPISASPAHSRSPPKSRRHANTSTITNRGLEASMRSAGAPPTPIARFLGTISSYISGRSQANQTGEPSMPILRPVSRDPIDLIDDEEDEPCFPVLNHVPTPIRPTPARQRRQKRVEPRINMPALQHVSPARPIKEPTRGRPRMRRVASVKELAKSFELMEEKSREEADIARSVGARRVVSEPGRPRLIPTQVHYSAPSAPAQLNRPKALPKPARTAPAVPLLPAVPPRAPPARSTRKPLKQPTRSRPAPPSAAKRESGS